MIITRTPFRISFVGGGSDLREFYKESEGAVLSTTINKYMYISSHHFFELDKIRAKYSVTETVGDIQDLEHPIIRETLKAFNVSGGLELSSIADIPSGTGMGSSSAFTVGLYQNLYAAIQHKEVDNVVIAEDACRMEIEVLKEPIGKQDQYAAAVGGLNIFRFKKDGQVVVDPIDISNDLRSELESNLVLYYIGNARKASDILGEQKKAMSDDLKRKVLKQMVDLVDPMKVCLLNEDLSEFGKLLHENWMLKKQLASKISNNHINELYEIGMANGALGGKLLGAGGGGFMLFYCPKSSQDKLSEKLNIKPFEYKFDQEGSKIIYNGES